jgi:hypothetical protein
MKMYCIDPGGHEEPGPAPSGLGVMIPDTNPSSGSGQQVKRICTGCGS